MENKLVEYRQLTFVDLCIKGSMDGSISNLCFLSWIEAMYPKERENNVKLI